MAGRQHDRQVTQPRRAVSLRCGPVMTIFAANVTITGDTAMAAWKIAEAKARFSAVVRASQSEPQVICNRGRPVSALVSIDIYDELVAARREAARPTVAELLDELAEIRRAEPVDVEVPARADRPNPLLGPV